MNINSDYVKKKLTSLFIPSWLGITICTPESLSSLFTHGNMLLIYVVNNEERKINTKRKSSLLFCSVIITGVKMTLHQIFASPKLSNNRSVLDPCNHF